MRLTLRDRVAARLSSRLETHVRRPVALALSGGGDSVALLHLAADWARANGRPLLALTVDHGLNPDAARWSEDAARAARALGAEARVLRWDGPRPSAGLPAAARAARHRLIAQAARTAGVRVVLFAHTADDVAEGDWMREEGSTLGRLREWSPSPAWPEGRGLMLLRPLLDVPRLELRALLSGLGADWVEDPANADPRFARARARAALAGLRLDPVPAPRGSGRGVLAVEDDLVRLSRDASARALAAALVCCSGGDRPPRGDRLDRLRDRLAAGGTFAAVVCGARIEAADGAAVVFREAGEFRRRAVPPLVLEPGVETVWDGRWAFTASGPGWTVRPAAGHRARLSDADRALLDPLPAAARGARPVLIRHGEGAPVLAGREVKAHSLVGQRLALALDRMTHERDLDVAPHGAMPWNHLFSGADISV